MQSEILIAVEVANWTFYSESLKNNIDGNYYFFVDLILSTRTILMYLLICKVLSNLKFFFLVLFKYKLILISSLQLYFIKTFLTLAQHKISIKNPTVHAMNFMETKWKKKPNFVVKVSNASQLINEKWWIKMFQWNFVHENCMAFCEFLW